VLSIILVNNSIDTRKIGITIKEASMHNVLRIGALISGGGSNLQAIIDACRKGAVDGEIVFVGTDNPQAAGLDRARADAIPTFVVDYRSIIAQSRTGPEAVTCPDDADMEALIAKQRLWRRDADPASVRRFLLSRVAAERRLLNKMQAYPFDLLVLAGFMRTLTPYFIDHINKDKPLPRIMNIHPALLPSFAGTDGYGDTFRYGCKVAGCTVHFIDYGEDSGPIIGQRAFRIEEDDSLDSVRLKGLKLEWDLYPECIQMYAKGRLRVESTTYSIRGCEVTRRRVHINP
jgi:phosphoribosylglycinamide formyltransferase-1